MSGELIADVSDVPATTPNDFISQVLSMPDSDKKVDILDRLLKMKHDEEERQAKRDFDEHFALLRADLGPVAKRKENSFLKSRYATLDSLQVACDPVIFKHGFSYSWREEALPEGAKRVYLDISGYGWTKSNFFDCPHVDPIKNREGREATNPLQMQGVMTTYGQRYTFKAGFGIVTTDDDNDGNTVTISPEVQDAIDKISAAETVERLLDNYKIAGERFKNEPNISRLITGAYGEARRRFVNKAEGKA